MSRQGVWDVPVKLSLHRELVLACRRRNSLSSLSTDTWGLWQHQNARGAFGFDFECGVNSATGVHPFVQKG